MNVAVVVLVAVIVSVAKAPPADKKGKDYENYKNTITSTNQRRNGPPS